MESAAGETVTKNPSRVGFTLRLVASIVIPVTLIGTALWWLVAEDRVDQAVERRAVTVAELVSLSLDSSLGVSSDNALVVADSAAVDDAVSGVVEPVLGSTAVLTVVGLDGSILYTSGPPVGSDGSGFDLLDASVFRGLASGQIDSGSGATVVIYSVPVAVEGRTLAAARVVVLDDPAIADAVESSNRLLYIFAGALLAIVVALVPLCWWSLGEIRRQYKRTRTLAMNDNLTGLANRTQFHERLDDALAGAARSEIRVGLIMLDLDGFKAINDTGGHAAGDRLLRRVAAALGEATRRNELACRLGGDEFAVIAPRITDRDELRGLADRLHDQLDLDVSFSDGRTLRVTASLGLALYPDDATSSDDLVNVADTSMYTVKASRKARLPKSVRDRADAGR